MDAWRTFGAEAIVTFLLVTVVVSVALNPQVPPGVAALAIGFALTAAIISVVARQRLWHSGCRPEAFDPDRTGIDPGGDEMIAGCIREAG